MALQPAPSPENPLPFDPESLGPFVQGEVLEKGMRLDRGKVIINGSFSWASRMRLFSGDVALNRLDGDEQGVLRPTISISAITPLDSAVRDNESGNYNVDRDGFVKEVEKINLDQWNEGQKRQEQRGPIGILICDNVAQMTHKNLKLLDDLMPGWREQPIGPVVIKIGGNGDVVTYLCNGTTKELQYVPADLSKRPDQKERYIKARNVPYEGLWFDP